MILHPFQEAAMTFFIDSPEGQEIFEYHGNTTVERTRQFNGTVERDWILFDTVEEASAYFHEQCA
jgi:hypothetical protein